MYGVPFYHLISSVVAIFICFRPISGLSHSKVTFADSNRDVYVHSISQYWYSSSVRLSVRDSPVLCPNG